MVLWVFGYGSLIWNPGFDFDDKILGFIKGYKRTFNLGIVPYSDSIMCPTTSLLTLHLFDLTLVDIASSCPHFLNSCSLH